MAPTETGKSNLGVTCHHCGSPIPVLRVERVTAEFVVPCPHCGRRGFFEIKDIKPLPASAGWGTRA
jgi:DNA-directed RNA polymerase subunit RPC12/RpoP